MKAEAEYFIPIHIHWIATPERWSVDIYNENSSTQVQKESCAKIPQRSGLACPALHGRQWRVVSSF